MVIKASANNISFVTVWKNINVNIINNIIAAVSSSIKEFYKTIF